MSINSEDLSQSSLVCVDQHTPRQWGVEYQLNRPLGSLRLAERADPILNQLNRARRSNQGSFSLGEITLVESCKPVARQLLDLLLASRPHVHIDPFP